MLPFTNMSGDPDQDYFADGLTEDIITDLSQVSALSVVARHTAFAFKGKTLHLQQVARDLNVDYVLEGSVRKSDGRLRVTAQLIDGATGDHRWAHRYDRRFEDVFALQDEISKSIVDVLKVTLLPAELETITRHPTADAHAYEYYLMGRFFYLRGMASVIWPSPATCMPRRPKSTRTMRRAYAGMAICDSSAAAAVPDGSFETALAQQRAGARVGCQPGGGLCRQGIRAVRSRALRRGGGRVRARHEAGSRPVRGAFLPRSQLPQPRPARGGGGAVRAGGGVRPNDFRSPGLLAWECKALGRREQFAAALRRCLARLEAEVKAHPDNADALVFGSSILVESGDSARAEDWLARAIILALGRPLRSIQRGAHQRDARQDGCCVGSSGTGILRIPHLPAPPGGVDEIRREMDGLRDHPRFQALLANLDAGGATAAARTRARQPSAERDARRQRNPRSPCCRSPT